MRTAETVLSITRERGQRGLPLGRVYRQLYNRNLYLRAYGKLYANKGAMTPGVTSETVDGMSLAKIDGIIDALKQESLLAQECELCDARAGIEVHHIHKLADLERRGRDEYVDAGNGCTSSKDVGCLSELS